MRVSKLFGAGVTGRLMLPEFSERDPIHAWFQNRHAQHARNLLDNDHVYHSGPHSWKVPYGIRYALSQPLIHVQIINQYPWGVTWRSPKSGKRLRKGFSSLVAAIDFITTKAQYVDKKASIYSRQRHYDIPSALRGKIPLPFKWCPRCLTARRFVRILSDRGDPETFVTLRKEWSDTRGRYEWMERKLALTKCRCCGTTNRNSVMRRSNQPWEKRLIKQGATRIRKTKKTRS